jgi:hypothetical protein
MILEIWQKEGYRMFDSIESYLKENLFKKLKQSWDEGGEISAPSKSEIKSREPASYLAKKSSARVIRNYDINQLMNNKRIIRGKL